MVTATAAILGTVNTADTIVADKVGIEATEADSLDALTMEKVTTNVGFFVA